MHYFADTAVKVATLAGQDLHRIFRMHRGSSDGTDARCLEGKDLSREKVPLDIHEVERVIIDVLRENCPTHNIQTETTALTEKKSPYTWLINPLDGCNNFLNHNPFFASSICLVFKNEPITSVIMAPCIEEIIVARKGHGCTLNGRKVTVSSTHEMSETRIVGCGRTEENELQLAKIQHILMPQIKDFRSVGSASLACCMIAAGRADAFITAQISPIRVTAGILAVQEAGGDISDFDGRPWKLGQPELLVSNGMVHNNIMAIQHGNTAPQYRRSPPEVVSD